MKKAFFLFTLISSITLFANETLKSPPPLPTEEPKEVPKLNSS